MRHSVGAVWVKNAKGERSLMCVATPEVADRWFTTWTAAGRWCEVTAENSFDDLDDVPDVDGVQWSQPNPSDTRLLAGFVASLYRVFTGWKSLADAQNWLTCRREIETLVARKYASAPDKTP